ncbi:MAG: alpha/beta fold hydrolase [Planctomycetota bacterium]|nr:alpha/beta fold hydrolase [Planctomycetota bacterium]
MTNAPAKSFGVVRGAAWAAALAASVWGAGALAQEGASPAGGSDAPAWPATGSFRAAKHVQPTRRDMAMAYMRFEEVLALNPPAAERVAEVNRAFDGLTEDFFMQRTGEAVRRLHELTHSLTDDGPMTGDELAVHSLRGRIDPESYCPLPDLPAPVIRVQTMYDVPESGAGVRTVRIELREQNATRSIVGIDLAAEFGPGDAVDATLALPGDLVLRTGRYEVVARMEGVEPRVLCPFWVMPAMTDALGAELEDLLEVVDMANDRLDREVQISKKRASLLTSTPSEDRSAQFLADPMLLAGEVRHEYQTMDDARSPFRYKGGEYWRVLDIGSNRGVPMVVYAPGSVVMKRRPAPLVVCLHGAGGDESMFMRGYGAGLIRTLAEQRGFIAVSVSTLLLGSEAKYLSRLVDDMAVDYDIDRSRVYLVGHSLGGIAASGLAWGAREVVAGAVCIAGYRDTPADPAPAATLVIAGELDRIFPPARLADAEKVAEAGGPVETRVIKDYGHTLVVARALPEAIAWLLEKRNERAAAVGPRPESP